MRGGLYEIRPAREPLRGHNAADRVARAVALGAMTEAVHEISAAIPSIALGLIRFINTLSKIHNAPNS